MSSSIVKPTIPASGEFWAFDSAVAFDSLEGKQSYLVYAKNGSQIKLSGSAYFLLQSIRSGNSFSELARTLNAREGVKEVTEDELRSQHESLLAKLHGFEMQNSRQSIPWGFWMRFRLIHEEYVARITRVTSYLYHPVALCCTIALLLAGAIFALHKGFEFTFSASSLMPGTAIVLVALLAHEIGHASACARYGSRPSDIGFTFYLIYPAFYSDVSSAWRLKRWQRVMVDLGGCYFQAIVTLVFTFFFYRTGWEPLRVAVILSLSSAISSMNPIFKFDGYWVLADMLGVVNLSSQPKRIYRYLLDRFHGRSAEILPWPPAVTAVLIGYSALALIAWTFFVIRLIPMVRGMTMTAGMAGAALEKRIVSGRMPVCQDVTNLFFSCILLLLIAVTLWSIVNPLCRTLVRATVRIARYFRGGNHTVPVSLNGSL